VHGATIHCQKHEQQQSEQALIKTLSIKEGEEEASRTWSLKETLKHPDAIQLGGRFKSDNKVSTSNETTHAVKGCKQASLRLCMPSIVRHLSKDLPLSITLSR